MEKLAACAVADVRHPTVMQLKRLLDIGVPHSRVARALRLAREAPFSVNLVEQAHGGGASILRQHKRMNAPTLISCSALHQARHFFEPSQIDKQIAKVRAKLEKLQSARESFSGFNLFVQRMSRRGYVPTEHSHIDSAVERGHASLALGHQLYTQLPQSAKVAFSDAARSVRANRRVLIKEAVDECIDELLVLEGRRRDVEFKSKPNHMDSLRLGCSDIERMCEMYCSNQFQRLLVDRMTIDAARPPAVPTREQQSIIVAEETACAIPEKPRPWWLQMVALNRDRFKDAAFSWGSPRAEVAYFIMYSTLSPYAVTFLRLQRRERVLPAVEALGPAEHLSLDELLTTTFTYSTHTFVLDEELLEFDEEDMFAWTDLRFEDDITTTRSLPVAFDVFTARFPRAAAARARGPGQGGQRRTDSKMSVRAELLNEFPWLTEEDFNRIRGRRDVGRRGDLPDDEHEGSGSGSDGPGSGVEGEDVLAFHDEVIDVADEVRAIREEFHFDAVDMAFYTRVLAGRWTMAHRHVPADAIAGYARGELVKQWCRTYKVPAQKSFAFSVYGNEAAIKFAIEYCRRANHFYQIWSENFIDDDFFKFTDVQLASYFEELEFLDFAIGLDNDSDAFARVIELRNMRPTNLRDVRLNKQSTFGLPWR